MRVGGDLSGGLLAGLQWRRGLLTAAVTVWSANAIGLLVGVLAESLQGTVDENSVEQDGTATIFSISYNGVSMPVHYNGEPGGIFKECIPVVVHGVIENGTLLGDRVEVKHSEEYVAVNDERVADAEAAGCSDNPIP